MRTYQQERKARNRREQGRRIQEASRALKNDRRCANDQTHNGPFEWDHIVPVNAGGEPEGYPSRAKSWAQLERLAFHPNIQVLCAACHREKSNQDLSEWHAERKPA